MEPQERVPSCDEPWESGALGLDLESARAVELSEGDVNQSLGLKAISIRLEVELIETFKAIATIHGLGYQPLMRQVLRRFAESEMKRLLMERANEVRNQNPQAGQGEIKAA